MANTFQMWKELQASFTWRHNAQCSRLQLNIYTENSLLQFTISIIQFEHLNETN